MLSTCCMRQSEKFGIDLVDVIRIRVTRTPPSTLHRQMIDRRLLASEGSEPGLIKHKKRLRGSARTNGGGAGVTGAQPALRPQSE